MAPKKAAATKDEASEGAQPFKWEGANDLKLLLLIQGRHALPDEYEQLATAFPGVSTGGIRNRISNLRIKQRELYESLGWALPESVAANGGKRAPKAAKKRGADESDAADETPKKKVTKKRVADESEGAGEEETPKKKKRTTTKKRTAGESDATGDAAETPVKKAMGKKAKKDELVKNGEGSAGEAEAEEIIKAEDVEEVA
ncbi:hypothetical protein yc1106_02972 [Curvularia clavata]|uniref:Uncharacterized protein n=1 Tax=Curvularia clavata TaxID=95742 RepID=A0A9Q9DPY5_CURCL|nr:hypothetical protein yc1106_02972 [Curvularia clavata]